MALEEVMGIFSIAILGEEETPMCRVQAVGQAGVFVNFFLSSFKSHEACSVAQGRNKDARNIVLRQKLPSAVRAHLPSFLSTLPASLTHTQH